jgi:hypothetical protein
VPTREIHKLAGWQTALSAYIESYRHRFQYGQHDCFTFVAGAIAAQTGLDVTEGIDYASRTEAWAITRARGGNLAKCFESIVAPYRIVPSPIAFCRRGDPVVIRQGQRGASLGIVSLTGRDVVTVTSIGITRLPMARVFQGFTL